MKNKLFLLSFVFISTISIAQSTMSIKKVPFSGSAIFLNGSKISLNEAKEIAKNNQEIVNKINYAQTNRTFGAIIGIPGGFAFGYTLGSSFSSNTTIKPNWAIGGIGAAMMVVGTIMQFKGDKQLKEAVEEYNTNISKNTSLFNPEFYLVSTENGIGLTMKF
ncbi:hypothetical protein [Flavobacterium sp.]|uniref:hypothetical protein n=1 Tax=Flavobacterium sp. TaxID=239 RepID=UPI00286B358A|nr:hypothetical protein [Flavobacterium sp.]